MKTGIELIAYERKRQIEKEGYTKEHDAGHVFGEMAYLGATYALIAIDPITAENSPQKVQLVVED